MTAATHRTRELRALLLAALIGVGAAACPRQPAAPNSPPPPHSARPPTPLPVAVNCRPEQAQPLPAATGGAVRRCVIDVGSRNVKLLVASVRGDDPSSITSERVCRARLQLGEKTFDQQTQQARPLLAQDQDGLARLIDEYAASCKRDGGQMLGAVATEWARRASNADQVRRAVQERTGIALDVLSHEQEGEYGYLAATRGSPGKVVLDYGSRSLQVSYWPTGAATSRTAFVRVGIDDAGDRFFGHKEHRNYGAARGAFAAEMRAALSPALEQMRAALAARTLSPELFSLGENGDVSLALAGRLWDRATGKAVDEASYSALLKNRAATLASDHGPMTATMAAREVTGMARALESDAGLFEELRSDRTKRIYGYKMLAFPALVALLAQEIGLTTLVLVPQEMAEGLIVHRLRGAGN